eukprot:CAMPEP_0202968556 /NCGR_PEP_ID=MMETSP1396-20130829/13900_1 /ASSEMBLY_ACC=CAM_ASM_000872 /TAXON_ID= /ORGANISM="Pseudokeronopsis sp., Strain Brazil" /LENGTH=54 /DNA_ID=CAMNT_0049694995 /DNA_START=1132 /DNA_END=1296 /DNA_ORIENTATION=+
MSGFELMIEVAKGKAYINVCYSLMSVALLNKEARNGIELLGNPISSHVNKEALL